MEDDVGTVHRRRDGIRVAYVAVHQLDVVDHIVEVHGPSGGQIVERPDAVAAIPQGVDEVGADEPGSAGHDREARHQVRPSSTSASPRTCSGVIRPLPLITRSRFSIRHAKICTSAPSGVSPRSPND